MPSIKELQYKGKTYNQWVNAYNKGQASYGDYLIARKVLVEDDHKGHTVTIDGSDINLPGTVDGVDLSAHAADPAAHHEPGGGGITKLSELEIDADKEMAFKVLSKLGGLDKGQVRGDIWIFSLENHANLVVKRLPAPEAGKVFCSGGLGKDPFWAWLWEEPGGSSSLVRFYPAVIGLTRDEQIIAVDQSHNVDAPLTSPHAQNYLDDVAHYIKRLTPTIALVDAEAVVTPDQTHNENCPIASSYELNVE